MSEPIKVGDLVMVIRDGVPCPANCDLSSDSLGHIFRVSEIKSMLLQCTGCGTLKGVDTVACQEGSSNVVYRLPRLKRIPPLSELESEKNKEELTA